MSKTAEDFMKETMKEQEIWIRVASVAYFLTKGKLVVASEARNLLDAVLADADTARMFTRVLIGAPLSISLALGQELLSAQGDESKVNDTAWLALDRMRELYSDSSIQESLNSDFSEEEKAQASKVLKEIEEERSKPLAVTQFPTKKKQTFLN